MAGFKTEWNIGDICVMVASGPKRYTQEFKVQSFDGKYYTVRRGDDLYHVSPSRMFQTKEEALASLDSELVSSEDSFRRLTEEKLAEEKKAKMPRINGEMVALTPDDEGTFMGYVTDRKWNGWECPLFPKSSADKIMEYINSSVGDMNYDIENDSYTMKYFEGEEVECFEGEDYLINGNIERLYPIGSYSWIWERERAPEENENIDEDNSQIMGM